MAKAAREVDLLMEFYEVWCNLHQRRHEGADREELETLAQDLAEAKVAIDLYRSRHAKH